MDKLIINILPTGILPKLLMLCFKLHCPRPNIVSPF
ncbi:hypothetical protein EVA_06131 [gut metagenome]|uniref:Uncharacterized protein n=1 Tax=gut metagenome TaxID=749906 RepID=J9CZM3_9ZZZZ